MHQQYVFCYYTSLAINNSQTTVATVNRETFIVIKICIHGSYTEFKLTKCIRFEIILYRNSQKVKFVKCQHMFLGYTNMVFLNFLKPYCKDGLPDLRGNLSTEVPSRAYAQVSQEVQQTLASQKCQVGKQTGYVQKVWLHSVQIR